MEISLFGSENMLVMDNKIIFAKEDQEFLNSLNNRVKVYLDKTGGDKYANSQVHLKAAVMFFCYLTCYCLVYKSNSVLGLYACYALMGPLTVFLALNIGHEAAHNIFCKRKKLNKFFVHIFDLMGASSLIWKYKHVHTHHNHTNIHKVDMELEQPEIVRIFPQSTYRFFHRYQQYYMPFLYSIYTLIWFCLRDFKDFFKLRHKMSEGQPLKELLWFLGSKFFFVFRMIILPAVVLPFSWLQVLFAFLICNLVASITVTFALISTHVGEHSQFPQPDRTGRMSHSWVMHQFMTTSDFSRENKLVTALYGGFNHHLTHHLFPYISHVHYPSISKIIEKVSKDYQISIYPQPSIAAAIASHFRFLGQRARNGEGQVGWMEM